MRNFFVRRAVVTIIFGIVALSLVGFFIFRDKTGPVTNESDLSTNLVPRHTIIGTSVEGRNIDAYAYGEGETHLVFIGGIHGGYEWNSVVLAYKFLDYLDANPTAVPENITVTMIPSANPDGVYKVIGKEGRFTSADVPADVSTVPGRFNANNVDLNRNFDCKWKPEAVWRDNPVSTGTEAFSEPEAKALRDFLLEDKPRATIFWHSQSNAVYASECRMGILPETLEILDVYSRASGYRAVKFFDAYETSGDAEGWLTSVGIPAITVELKTHETIEWEQNLAGFKALLEYYNVQE